MPNVVHHGWAAEKKLNTSKMCLDGLKQLFPNFLFSRTLDSDILLVFFRQFKQKCNLFIFVAIDKL